MINKNEQYLYNVRAVYLYPLRFKIFKNLSKYFIFTV
jgi:hypothetical protein